MSRISASVLSRLVLGCLAILCVLIVNNALPGLLTPTLGQAIWTTGFAQAFANQGLTALHTQYFGMPAGGAIAFGLAGAWPTSLLLRLGLAPADAYSAMVAFWLIVAFLSASRLARQMGGNDYLAILGAALWTSLPVIWAHSDYSMLSLGIALLPFYFLALTRLVDASGNVWRARALYPLVTIIAVFMDGYTFMMFAAGASLTLAYLCVTRAHERMWLLRNALPVHILGFALAYLLYTRYVGTAGFDRSPIDFFRGWGVDLSFLVIPSQGILWLPDLLGMSLLRTTERYYGDASTWQTTFALPLLLAACLALAVLRRRRAMAFALLAGALLALYLALGPSLKINSIKPQNVSDQMSVTLNPLMPAERAVAPTGSAWLSTHLPGFSAMRASYRWSALALFAVWCLLMLQLPALRNKRLCWGMFGVLILLNLPHPIAHLRAGLDARTMFSRIDEQMRNPLMERVKPGEMVAFIPWGNDFLANYLAPSLGVRTFNVGGDKGGEQARTRWPTEMLGAGPAVPSGDASALVRLLLNGEADVLVIPYVNLLWSAHWWPCIDQTEMRMSAEQRENAKLIPDFHCPHQIRQQREELLQLLRSQPAVAVEDGELFATVRLASSESVQRLRDEWLQGTIVPTLPQANSLDSIFMLGEGWYFVEPGQVWSGPKARLDLPVPATCREGSCEYRLTLTPLAASAERPVEVRLRQDCAGGGWNDARQLRSGQANDFVVPVCPGKPLQSIWIDVDKADSPQHLLGIPDQRVLGVSLSGVHLQQQK